MLSSQRFLRICQKLKDHGIQPRIRPGIRVGRGMADVGAEEFIALSENRLLSLFTGKITEINESELRHLFWIPNSDEMVDAIETSGSSIERVEFEDRRAWRVTLAGGREVPAATSISEALLHAFVVASFSAEVARSIISDPQISRLITERVVNE